MTIRIATLTCAAPATATPAVADYPERAVELTTLAGAGGGTDTSARKLALLLEKAIGQSIAVMNVSGGGSVGASQFVRAAPDGHPLFATWNSPPTTVPQVQDVADSLDSFTPIASMSETACTLQVGAGFPATAGEGLLAELAANPGAYTHGHDGIGGTMQLAAVRIIQARGIEAVAIPFGGARETL
jgi:tripartite-type tricarboxylate transporter receptor subunit TctC